MMNIAKLLSVIICTRNRADEIVNCLPEMAKQAREFSDVEVIIVDNGSIDNTEEVVKNLSEKLYYPFRYVYEPIAGLCQARNRGRAEAKGTIIAYIDDDEKITVGWIEKIRGHFLKNQSECLGGKISVKILGLPPKGFTDEMLWFFGATKLGDSARFLQYPEHPQGGNFAVKVEVFDKVNGFDTNLTLYGDETEFFRRVSQNGFSMYYDPNIEVVQEIPAKRISKKELQHKSYIWGKGSATVWLLTTSSWQKRILKIAEYSLRTSYMKIRSVSNRDFGKFYTHWYNRGYLAQLLKGLGNSKK